MPNLRVLIPAVLCLFLGACVTGEYGTKQTAGSLFGAAAGAALGSIVGGGTGQIVATAAGTVLGLFLGSEVGKSLDRADRLHASQAQHTALETQRTGASVVWRSPDSGNTGRVTPTRTVHTPQGTVCREYRHEVTISGNTETVHGTACRQADGSWQIANRPSTS